MKHLRILLLLLCASTGFAQESALSLAKRAEALLFASPAVAMKFSLPNEGDITATVDLIGKHIRIESKSTLMVSDGSTVQNLSKNTKRLTIDNVAKTSSPFADPASLFRFAENYSASIVRHAGSSYTLELTPNKSLAPLMKAAGDAQKLSLTLTASSKRVKIVEASVISSKGATRAGKLTITSLKRVKPEQFAIKPAKDIQIIDLRE
jgi:hypothetical protein